MLVHMQRNGFLLMSVERNAVYVTAHFLPPPHIFIIVLNVIARRQAKIS